MTVTPDTHTDELAEQLRETIEATLLEYQAPVSVADPILEALEDVLAEIRRHAAADALQQQAKALRRSNTAYLKQMLTYDYGSDAYKLTQARAGQATADARRLENAAQDLVAEGYKHTCGASWAATRTDPGYGCDTPVENEGDLCDRHDAGDDEDRWSE